MQVSQRCLLFSFSKLCPSRTRASLMAVFCLAAPALARNTGFIAPGHGLCLERCWRGKWQPEAIRQFTLVLLALQMHCEETTPDAKARQHFSYFDCIHMFNTLQVLMVKEILPLRWWNRQTINESSVARSRSISVCCSKVWDQIPGIARCLKMQRTVTEHKGNESTPRWFEILIRMIMATWKSS